jgi:hypothetical protein|tara:strand:+ start:2394 stop:2666 length:273 start_codon:yes stop_codon:yes gene_type:complete
MKQRFVDSWTFTVIMTVVLIGLFYFITESHAATPKAKFYDFNEQLIDGEIKKPTTLYTDSHRITKFNRLLKLKKSFLPKLFKTSKEKVFK